MKFRKIIEGLLLLLSALLALGARSVFAPCGAKDDGSYMSCHWAGVMVFALALLLLVMAVLLLAAKDGKLRMGILAAMLPTEVLLAIVPGILISLCMMPDMRCRMLLRPFAIAMGILLLVFTAAGLAAERRAQHAEVSR